MTNLTKIAALPMAGGAMAALPAEKAITEEPKITDHDEAAKLAAKLVGEAITEAITEAIEAYKTAMREMVRAMADEVVRKVITEIPKGDDGDGFACGGLKSVDAMSVSQNFGGTVEVDMTDEESKAYRVSGRNWLGWSFTPNAAKTVAFTVMAGDWESWKKERNATFADLIDAAGGGE